MNEISIVLQVLTNMRQTKGRHTNTKLEMWISKASNFLYLASGCILAALGYLALLMAFVEISKTIELAGICIAIGAISLALGGLVLSTTSLLLAVASSFMQDASIRAQEHDHDLANVAELLPFEERTLSCALKSMEIRIDRMQQRTAYLIGGNDKLSLLAIVGLSWTVWTNYPLNSAIWNEKPFVFGMAFLAGITMGGVLVNLVLRRYRYQKDILQLALEYKKHGIPLHRHYAHPPVPSGIRMVNAYRAFLSYVSMK